MNRDKKVTIYIPEEEHRRLKSTLALHGESMSPLALRLLVDWTDVQTGARLAVSESKPIESSQFAAEHRALEAILRGGDVTARRAVLALLATLAPSAESMAGHSASEPAESPVRPFVSRRRRRVGMGLHLPARVALA
jgi:hypothetical protein